MQREKTNGQDEATAWVWAGLWLLSIYVSIPLARAVQENMQTRGLRMAFLWITFAFFVVAGIAMLRFIRRRAARISLAQGGMLAAIFSLFGGMTWSLRSNPEEAFHFVQYGVFSLLVVRALYHRFRDPSIYIIAAAIGAVAGILDELIQWITPRRYFDYRDIGINVLAGLLVQAALAWGIRLPGIARPFSRNGLRAGLGATAAGLMLMLFCVANTPAFKSWYSNEKLIPAAAKIPDTTIEYGVRIDDPDIGIFYSRLTPDQLAVRDRDDGKEAAAFISHYKTDARYHQFLARFPAHQHPLAVEARIHVFRRDHYAARMRDQRLSARERGYHAWVADREQAILERYFPVTLAHSIYTWTPERRAWIASEAVPDGVYVSVVSRHLVTRVRPAVMVGSVMAVLILVLLGERWVARKWPG